ncbi:MAG: hypothetical protein V4487_00915 [Chlamydiota bacterium]
MSLITIKHLIPIDNSISFQYDGSEVSIPLNSISQIRKTTTRTQIPNPNPHFSALLPAISNIMTFILKKNTQIKWPNGKILVSFETGLSKKEYAFLETISNPHFRNSPEEQETHRKMQTLAKTHLYSLKLTFETCIDADREIGYLHHSLCKKDSTPQPRLCSINRDFAINEVAVEQKGISFTKNQTQILIPYTEIGLICDLKHFAPAVSDPSSDHSLSTFFSTLSYECHTVCCYVKQSDQTIPLKERFEGSLTQSAYQSLTDELNLLIKDEKTERIPTIDLTGSREKQTVVSNLYFVRILYIPNSST